MVSYSLVSDEDATRDLIKTLKDLSAEPPLFLDLEGVSLSRDGTVSLVNILVPTKKHVYLVDVFTLQGRAFTVSDAQGTTLKDILESQNIINVFFDVRNDSDALFAHYGICLQGIEDVQLMEVASRNRGRRFVKGLSKCIQRDLYLAATERIDWESAKDKGLKLFHPDKGGSYAVFNERPLCEEIITYSVNDVRYLPRLRQLYMARMSSAWRTKVDVETRRRVTLSQSAEYVPRGKDKAISPWT